MRGVFQALERGEFILRKGQSPPSQPLTSLKGDESFYRTRASMTEQRANLALHLTCNINTSNSCDFLIAIKFYWLIE